tara:strand:- start:89 stop:292 length:204 start_codon:yes stop_codon:yes gene_type:complete
MLELLIFFGESSVRTIIERMQQIISDYLKKIKSMIVLKFFFKKTLTKNFFMHQKKKIKFMIENKLNQ